MSGKRTGRVFVLGVSIKPLPPIFLLEFRIVPTLW